MLLKKKTIDVMCNTPVVVVISKAFLLEEYRIEICGSILLHRGVYLFLDPDLHGIAMEATPSLSVSVMYFFFRCETLSYEHL